MMLREVMTNTVAHPADWPRGTEPMLDQMTDAFFAIDADWTFTYLNGRRGFYVADDGPGIPADD